MRLDRLAPAGCLVLGLVVAACSTSSPTRQSTSPPSTTVATPPLALGVPAPPSSGTSTSVAATPSPRCTNADVAVADSGGGAGLGNVDQVLVFTNVSASPCRLVGYPGVAALDPSGHQVVQARRSPTGYMGGLLAGATPSVVSLAPNESASALVEGTDNPVGAATSCPKYPNLLVTPPDLTKSVRVRVTGLGSAPTGFPGCTPIYVHPVVAGTTGSQPGF